MESQLFAVDNYDPLIAELENVVKAIPSSESYVGILDRDIKNQEAAVQTGNKADEASSALKGAEDTKAGAQAVESNAALYNLADVTAPEQLKELGEGFEKGTATAADENNLMGAFDQAVKAALANA